MANETTNEAGLTAVTVSADKVQEVLDFVQSLGSADSDVSGHMLSRGVVSAIGGGALGAKGRTLSSCWQTGGTGFGTDWSCSDTDAL